MQSKLMKHVTFSPNISCARLLSVQQLLGQTDDESAVPDAILCIIGIDSHYNAGCQRLVNYLLFDFHETARKQLNSLGVADEIIDDILLLVKCDCVHVYCNPVVYKHILPFISHWRNLHIHCLTDEEYEDVDEAEEFKVRSIVEMVHGCSLIGIPYSIDGKLTLEPKTLERWPMIQAMGLEEYGVGGVFTMNYRAVKKLHVSATCSLPIGPIKITDASNIVNEVYPFTDPVVLEDLITKELPVFEKTWSSMISLIDSTDPVKRNILTKENVEHPLKTYFTHAVEKSKLNRSVGPFVHFGKTSVKESLQSANKGYYTVPLTLKSCGVGGNNAPFMVCQTASPNTPLVCARTFFFSKSVHRTSVSDMCVTQTLYNAIVEGVLSAIKTYSLTHDFDEMTEAALAPINDVESSLPETIQNHLSKKDIITIRIEAFDNQGKKRELQSGDQLQMIKTLSMVVYDIPSVEINGAFLGSLMFSETFIDSCLNITDDCGNAGTDSDYMILTSQVPRAIVWNLNRTDYSNFPKVQVPLYNEPIYVQVVDSIDSAPFQGTLSVYNNAIVVGWPSFGDTLIAWRNIKSVQIFREDMSDVCVVIVNHILQLPHLSTTRSYPFKLALFLQPKTKAYKLFTMQVIFTWKQESHPVWNISELPGVLVKCYNEQQSISRARLEPATGIKGRPEWKSHMYRFLCHFEVSTCIKSSVEQDDLPKLMRMSEAKESMKHKFPITIISGIPGSGKDSLATAIKTFTENKYRWIMLNQKMDSTSQFKPSVIHEALQTAVLTAKKVSTSHRAPRILVVTSGFTDITDVVRAILGHPDPEILASIVIGAVTCCIDPYNTFVAHRMVFPVMLNQCLPGWVTNVVLSTTESDPEVDHVRYLIRMTNPDVPIHVTDQGAISRYTEVDLILSTTGFNEPDMIRHRLMSLPFWSETTSHVSLYPPMNEVILLFKPYLDRQMLVNEIKSINSQSCGNALSGNIYHIRGRITFQDTGELIEMNFTTKSNVLNWAKVDGSESESDQSPDFMAFRGCQLEEPALKNWLRKCTKRKYERKSEKSVDNLTAKELKQIHEENHLKTLPEGWFYNGQSYVSMDGERSSKHPEMGGFMDTYVCETNKDIRRYNSAVDENNSNDIFI